MKAEGHLEKAKAFEERANKFESEREAPSVIEDIFDACVHYIAYGINIKYGRDIDAHGKQKRLLRENDEYAILAAYNNLENIRIKVVYGGSWNGDRVETALEYLKEVKEWSKTIGE